MSAYEEQYHAICHTSYSHLNESAGHPSSSNASLRKAISFALQSDKNVKMLAASTFLYIQKFMSHLETLFLVSPWYLGPLHSIDCNYPA